MKITPKQYAETLYDLTDGKNKAEAEKLAADFGRYIYKEGKLKLAGKIIEQFSKIYNRENGIVEAEVTTAEKISGGTEKKLKDFIEKKYHAKVVVLKNTVDEKIKGGIIIRVGDEIIDGSISGRLSELKKVLVA